MADRLIEEPLEGAFHEIVAAAGPSTVGPSTAGPSTAGPSTAGPSIARPSTVAGASAAGHRFECNVCGNSYQSRDGLVKHFKKHTKGVCVSKLYTSFQQ